jgi:ectoine hydroxylase-related dioxygenase (phytanoyl-CoA dioxygenase family)
MMSEPHRTRVTDEDLERYREDGVVCVRGVLDAGWVTSLRAAADEAVARQATRARGIDEAGRPQPAFHNLFFLHRTDERVRAVALRSPAASVAKQLLGCERLILRVDHLLVKEPGALEPTPWHHDLPYWPVRGEQIGTVWIALDPVSADNGGLRYVAGSHRWGHLYEPCSVNGSGVLGRFEPLPDIDAMPGIRMLQWELAPGDVLVHDALTLHSSAGNTRHDVSRRGLALRFVGEKAHWAPADLPLDAFPEASSLLKPGDPLDTNGAFPTAEV